MSNPTTQTTPLGSDPLISPVSEYLSTYVLKGEVAPAEATALKVVNGEVKLTVEVDESVDLKTWKSAKEVEIAVPAEGEMGFYLLKSR